METFGKSNITVYHTKPSCMVNVNNQVSKQNFHFQIHIYKVNISPCCPQIERFKLFFVECDVKFNQLSSFSRFLFFSKLCPLLSLLCHQPQLLHQFIVFIIIIIINSIVFFYEFLTLSFPLYTQWPPNPYPCRGSDQLKRTSLRSDDNNLLLPTVH